MASRHKAISYLVFFFFPSFFLTPLIFQRNNGDFTVTFSDSLVSHCVWAGVRSDPSRCVVFAAPSSAPRVSGQISSHVIAVFLFLIATDNLLCTGALRLCSSSFLEFCRRSGKDPNSKPHIEFAACIPAAVRYGQEISNITLESSMPVTQVKGKVYKYYQ